MQCIEAKTDEDILNCFSVMKFLRPHLEEGAFLEKRSFRKAYFCQCRSTVCLAVNTAVVSQGAGLAIGFMR